MQRQERFQLVGNIFCRLLILFLFHRAARITFGSRTLSPRIQEPTSGRSGALLMTPPPPTTWPVSTRRSAAFPARPIRQAGGFTPHQAIRWGRSGLSGSNSLFWGPAVIFSPLITKVH